MIYSRKRRLSNQLPL